MNYIIFNLLSHVYFHCYPGMWDMLAQCKCWSTLISNFYVFWCNCQSYTDHEGMLYGGIVFGFVEHCTETLLTGLIYQGPVDLWIILGYWWMSEMLSIYSTSAYMYIATLHLDSPIHVLCSYHSYLNYIPRCPTVSERPMYHGYVDTPGLSLDAQLCLDIITWTLQDYHWMSDFPHTHPVSEYPGLPLHTLCVWVFCLPQSLGHSRTITGCPTFPPHNLCLSMLCITVTWTLQDYPWMSDFPLRTPCVWVSHVPQSLGHSRTIPGC